MEKRITALGLVKGVAFHLAMCFSTYSGSLFGIFPFTILYPFHYQLFRNILDHVAASWYIFPVFIYEKIYGTKLFFTGDSIKSTERTVMILNHRTYFDWMFMWSWILRFGSLPHEKIVLKAPLKKIPGVGWALQFFLFLFVNRRWELDKPHMTKLLNSFVQLEYPVQFLIFPEGTDMDERGKRRSDEFAKKNGLPIYNYVLHPRTTGFVHTLTVLRNHVDAVYDLTVGYPKVLPYQRTSLLKGHFPQEIHFHLRRYPIQDIPTGEQELSDWLYKRWEEKEVLLKEFYERGYFDDQKLVCARDKDPSLCNLKLYGSFIIWTGMIVLPTLGLIYSPTVRWFFAAGHVCYLFFTFVYGGFDVIEVEKHNRDLLKNPKYQHLLSTPEKEQSLDEKKRN